MSANESQSLSSLKNSSLSSMTHPNSVWLSESQNELTSCGPKIDHRLQGFHYCISRMRCTEYVCNITVTNLLSSNGLYSLLLLFWYLDSVYLALLNNRLFQLVVPETCFNKLLSSNGFCHNIFPFSWSLHLHIISLLNDHTFKTFYLCF
jgi:hypothetical protein